MRIIAGAWRGRRLISPPAHMTSIRPTSDRLRENLFNILSSRIDQDWASQTVLDLCAGTGALGIEALSRGAAHATFIERDPVALDLIAQNISLVGATPRATILAGDASRLPRAQRPHSLVLLDPPYGIGHLGALDAMLASARTQGWVAPYATACVECSVSVEVSAVGWKVVDRRNYGKSALVLLTPDEAL